MKIPATTRLVVEDFPGQKDWIAPMFYVVNRFITSVLSILNKGLLFKDNIMGQEEYLDFTYTSASASFPKRFKWNYAIKPESLVVLSAYEETTSTTVTPVIVLPAWEYTDTGEISITTMLKFTVGDTEVKTLTQNARYRIKVRATP